MKQKGYDDGSAGPVLGESRAHPRVQIHHFKAARSNLKSIGTPLSDPLPSPIAVPILDRMFHSQTGMAC